MVQNFKCLTLAIELTMCKNNTIKLLLYLISVKSLESHNCKYICQKLANRIELLQATDNSGASFEK